MPYGPIQISLLVLCVCLAVGLAISLFRRPSLAYIRWFLLAGVCSSLAQDAIPIWAQAYSGGSSWAGVYLASELGGAMAWLLFSRRYARAAEEGHRSAPGWAQVVAACAVLGAVAGAGVFLAVRVSDESSSILALSVLGFAVRIVTLVLLILSLTNLETTLVNSVHGQRWRIKFSILGAFTVLAAQVFTVSLGLLYRTLDLSLTPARQTGFILGMAFLLYSTLFRGQETPVTVSRRLARSSVVLFGAGAYLLFLGALSVVMGMTRFSGNKALLLALGLVVGVCVLTLLLSEGVRRRFTRILQHYFYKEKYDYRVQWLSFTRRLSRADSRDKMYRAVLLGFCETFGMGGAVLYLKDPDHPRMSPVESWEIGRVPPAMENWSAVTRRTGGGVAAVDLRGVKDGLDPQSVSFLEAVGGTFAVPLMRDEALDGIILLARPIDSSEQYNQEDFDLMEALATHAYSAMLNYRLADQLAKSRDMEVMGKVSAFIVHDLKNLVYTLSLIVDNAKRYIQNAEFQSDMLKGLENTVSKMHILISQLRQLPSRENLTLERCDMMQLARETFKYSPPPGLVFKDGGATAMVDRTQMQKVILNLALNAREASREADPVVIETGTIDDVAYLSVADQGGGMSAAFMKENLFQPFKTSKSKGMGIGLYQCKQIVDAHGGSIDVQSGEGKGSVFTIRLPSPSAHGSTEDA
ncbi:MAG: XrtA/PEP-CTERM system histidine kinase PrsK [Acidobacteriota bacterium]